MTPLDDFVWGDGEQKYQRMDSKGGGEKSLHGYRFSSPMRIVKLVTMGLAPIKRRQVLNDQQQKIPACDWWRAQNTALLLVPFCQHSLILYPDKRISTFT